MGFVNRAGDSIREAKEITRWVEILEPDDVLKLPALEFEVKYINDATLLRLSKPFASRKENAAIDLNKERKFRSNFVVATVQDWRGVTNSNLRRLSDYFLTHPELFEGNDLDDGAEWPFDEKDLAFIGEHITSEKFGEVVAQPTNLQEFVRTQLEREKKE